MQVTILSKKYKEYVINLRRYFHQYPESSWEEINTSKRIKEELENMNIPYVSLAKTGILATINGRSSGKTIALRADIDALEITETNDISYKSKNPGKMHACGHDGHISMLLGAARILKELENTFEGTIKLIFQPAEEIFEGAKKIIEENDFMNKVDNVFAIHLWSGLPVGKVSLEPGPRMASADLFSIKVIGQAGHGSMPSQGVDALLVGAAITVNLQSAVSREINPLDPAVLSIGIFNSGTRFNIIANEAELKGTTRSFNPEVREKFPQIIDRIAKSTAAAYRAKAEVTYTEGPPPVINEEDSSKLSFSTVNKILGSDGISKLQNLTGSEDFAYFLEKSPGLLALVGAGNEEKATNYPHHHDKFNIDEDALEIGTALYAQYALDFLTK